MQKLDCLLLLCQIFTLVTAIYGLKFSNENISNDDKQVLEDLVMKMLLFLLFNGLIKISS